jgi:hypothetical protein
VRLLGELCHSEAWLLVGRMYVSRSELRRFPFALDHVTVFNLIDHA